jgi:hypothetical protein
MNDRETIHRRAEVYHQENTRKVLALLESDSDLRHLDNVFVTDLDDIYRKVLPRYANLCEIMGSRPLTKEEHAELAIQYESLCTTFGDEGTVHLAIMWLITKPQRQARGN